MELSVTCKPLTDKVDCHRVVSHGSRFRVGVYFTGGFLSSILWKGVKRNRTGQSKAVKQAVTVIGDLMERFQLGLDSQVFIPPFPLDIGMYAPSEGCNLGPRDSLQLRQSLRGQLKDFFNQCSLAAGARSFSSKGDQEGAGECPPHIITGTIQRTDACPRPRKKKNVPDSLDLLNFWQVMAYASVSSHVFLPYLLSFNFLLLNFQRLIVELSINIHTLQVSYCPFMVNAIKSVWCLLNDQLTLLDFLLLSPPLESLP